MDDCATVPGDRCGWLFHIALFAFQRAADDGYLGDGGDTGEGFATKAQGLELAEIFKSTDLAGSMAQADLFKLAGRDAVAIVGDTDQRRPPPRISMRRS